MVETVQQRVRQRPVSDDLKEIVELLNREHGPTIAEIRQRLNELIAGFNPGGDLVPAAGASAGFKPITIDDVEYVIEVFLPL